MTDETPGDESGEPPGENPHLPEDYRENLEGPGDAVSLEEFNERLAEHLQVHPEEITPVEGELQIEPPWEADFEEIEEFDAVLFDAAADTPVRIDTEGLPDDIDLSDHLLDRISEKFQGELGDAEGDHDERD